MEEGDSTSVPDDDAIIVKSSIVSSLRAGGSGSRCSNIPEEGMKGDIEGIEMLIEGGPSTGRKLLLLPRIIDDLLALLCIKFADGRLAMGIVDAELGNLVIGWPNSLTSDPMAFLVGSVMADLVEVTPGRGVNKGTGSELVWFSGGGMSLRFAEAEAVRLGPLSALSLFIDIFRRKPHLPDLVDALASILGAFSRFG
jgi:hypothetical protein